MDQGVFEKSAKKEKKVGEKACDQEGECSLRVPNSGKIPVLLTRKHRTHLCMKKKLKGKIKASQNILEELLAGL